MNTKQGDMMVDRVVRRRISCICLSVLLLIFQITFVNAAGLTISNIDVASMAGDKLSDPDGNEWHGNCAQSFSN